MTTAQHAFCHHCNGYRAMLFNKVDEVAMDGLRIASKFDGYALVCRACSNEVTKVGEYTRSEPA